MESPSPAPAPGTTVPAYAYHPEVYEAEPAQDEANMRLTIDELETTRMKLEECEEERKTFWQNWQLEKDRGGVSGTRREISALRTELAEDHGSPSGVVMANRDLPLAISAPSREEIEAYSLEKGRGSVYMSPKHKARLRELQSLTEYEQINVINEIFNGNPPDGASCIDAVDQENIPLSEGAAYGRMCWRRGGVNKHNQTVDQRDYFEHIHSGMGFKWNEKGELLGPWNSETIKDASSKEIWDWLVSNIKDNGNPAHVSLRRLSGLNLSEIYAKNALLQKIYLESVPYEAYRRVPRAADSRLGLRFDDSSGWYYAKAGVGNRKKPKRKRKKKPKGKTVKAKAKELIRTRRKKKKKKK
jgi:hypothetical protein